MYNKYFFVTFLLCFEDDNDDDVATTRPHDDDDDEATTRTHNNNDVTTRRLFDHTTRHDNVWNTILDMTMQRDDKRRHDAKIRRRHDTWQCNNLHDFTPEGDDECGGIDESAYDSISIADGEERH